QTQEKRIMRTDVQIIEELKKATEGLLFMSEADYPFEVVHLEGEVEPSQQRLRELGGAAADAPVETRSLEEFFRAAASEPEWKQGDELATARRFQSLMRLLKGSLSETRVYRVGEIKMAVFILGKSAEGNWLGLQTRAVET
ncbi:MAG TPA: nuclease A inhibitor family protein, partial [Pyrinomonadaceae bacterium]|nr:nuclease A inhibitor family protein [Pyrinomonadaceae bacterium]